jgi:hypothetical protein
MASGARERPRWIVITLDFPLRIGVRRAVERALLAGSDSAMTQR